MTPPPISRQSDDAALTSFFLGPRSENAPWVQEIIDHVLAEWFAWRKSLYQSDGNAISVSDQQSAGFQKQVALFRNEIDELLQRFNQEVPSFSPRYIGHMLTEVSLPALLGHMLTLLYNPNNISGEVSRVGLEIERNAIGALLSMAGFKQDRSAGHFTSGGTLANIEGALRARARMARWLAAGAAARKSGVYTGSLFEAAHMGWERYDELVRRAGLDDASLAAYHILWGNPFETAKRLEALFETSWLGPVMIVPGSKHYSWNKAMDVLGLGQEGFWEIETDHEGKLDPVHMQELMGRAREQNRPVLMVVSVAGTTELGEIDPVDDVQEVIDTLKVSRGIDIWHHVDAAYGGFFCTLMHDAGEEVLELRVMQALRAIGHTNSATIDPHKLGFVPYASGAFLCANRREYDYTQVHAPYIDFQPGKDPGPKTLEGSRSAAGAVSTWLTSRVIGFDRHGYGRIIERTVRAARTLAHGLMQAHPHIRVNTAGDTNIITFCVAKEGEAISETSKRSLGIYKTYSPGENHDFFVSKTTLGMNAYRRMLEPYAAGWNARWNQPELTLVRLVIMNPFLISRDEESSYILAFIEQLKTIAGRA